MMIRTVLAILMKRLKLIFALTIVAIKETVPLGGVVGCSLAISLFILDLIRLELLTFLEKHQFISKKLRTPMERRVTYYLIGAALWTWPCLPPIFTKPIIPDNLMIPIIFVIISIFIVRERSLLYNHNEFDHCNQVGKIETEPLSLRRRIRSYLIGFVLALLIHYPNMICE